MQKTVCERRVRRGLTSRSTRKGLPGGNVDISERYICNSVARVVRRLDSSCLAASQRDAGGRRHVVCGLDVALSYLPLLEACLAHAADPDGARANTDFVFVQSVSDAVAAEGTRRQRAELDRVMRSTTLCATFFADTHYAPAHALLAASEASAPLASRAVGCAAACYTLHALPGGCDAVLVTDDPIAAAIAEMNGAAACGLDDAIAMWGATPGTAADATLHRLLSALREAAAAASAASGAGADAATSGAFAPSAYVSIDAAERAIACGTLLRGTLRSRSGGGARAGGVAKCRAARTGATVSVELSGAGAMNRAIHGDTVAVEVTEGDATGADDDASPARGRVVCVLRRGWRALVATVGTSDAATSNEGREVAVLAIPMDARLPKLRLRTRQHAALAGHRLVVEYDRWDVDSQYPEGHYVRDIGLAGDVEAEVDALMVESQMEPHMRTYPEAAMAALPSAAWRVTAADISARRDMRDATVFSIDPPGCEDIDDAMSVSRITPADAAGVATFEVGVHIADVTHFVKPGSALDVEAQMRSTTVYLVDRRYNMLPPRLSSNLCSLRANIERCTMSAVWHVRMRVDGAAADDSSFEIVDTWIGKSVISSSAALTYTQAQDLVEGRAAKPTSSRGRAAELGAGPDYGDGSIGTGAVVSSALAAKLRPKIALLRRVARAQRAARAANGALELGGAEVEFTLDAEQRPVEVSSHSDMEIHHVVAELMIMANASVADRLLEKYPSCALVRRHMPPSKPRFAALQAAFDAVGVELDVTSNMALRTSLVVAELHLNAQVEDDASSAASLLRTLATRAMCEAEYVCSGTLDPDDAAGSEGDDPPLAHYGLAIPRYTHFTSPIRRYADVVVHRLLTSSEIEVEGAAEEEQTLVLPALPASMSPSMLIADDMMLDESIAAAAAGGVHSSTPSSSDELAAMMTPRTLQKVCAHLNAMTRNAKIASRNGERLALALLFRSTSQRVSGVVKDVRVSMSDVGVPAYSFEAWVPLLQLTARIHLTDAVTPSIWQVVSPEEEVVTALRLEAPGGRQCTVRPLALVTLDVSCDWDATVARCPSLRYALVAVVSAAAAKPTAGPTHLRLRLEAEPRSDAPLQRSHASSAVAAAAAAAPTMASDSMYHHVLQSMAPAAKQDVSGGRSSGGDAPPVRRCGASRFAFSGFVNGDLRKDPGVEYGDLDGGVALRPAPVTGARALLAGLEVKDHSRDVQKYGGARRGRLQSAKRNARVKKRNAK